MLKPGMFISERYEIIDKVGSGGMADVYKAKDQRLNRFVAIKVLKPEYSSDKSFVNKFRGEAQSAAGLSHPNIVNVYDVGDDSGLHYIVMELVEGITLKRFIERKGKLDIKEAVGIAIQIAQGMEAAHDNRIIHRDIKPQNIIISRDGKVKVTDFGIAKATNSNTITSNAMGSVHYLSPEQARGGYSDEKSDIYSLGVTIYEMLSGKVPFAGDNTVSVALLHIQGEAMPLRELDSTIPVSIDKIVQKCMQKRPERRYHTASELIADLKKAITNPEGDFVQIPAFVASDSPTINISDDLSRIKNGAYIDHDMQETKNTGKIVEDEEEDLDTVDSKVEKFFLIGSIATVVILAVMIIFLVFWFLFPKNSGTSEEGNTTETTLSPTPSVSPEPTEAPTGVVYKMPKVVGFTREDAEAFIKAKAPNAQISIETAASEDIAEGIVMEQYPLPDSEIDESFSIKLTVSKGTETFELPNLLGLTEVKAKSKLDELGLTGIFNSQYDDRVKEGEVISTTPERLTQVKKGDTITVVLSLGPENKQVVVPNLIGYSEEEATQILKDSKLVKGNVSNEPSTSFEKGKVTYQSTSAGQKVDAGSKVDIIVSTGSEDAETIGTGTVKYIGKVTIDINPFDYVGDGEGEVMIEVEQGDWQSTAFEKVITGEQFPLPITIESDEPEVGTVRMYVNGDLFTMPGDDETTWTVEFEAVED